MQLWWKVYFGIFAVLAAVGAMGAALRPTALTLVDWVDLLAYTPVALLALDAQAFGRSLLPETLWKVLRFACVCWKRNRRWAVRPRQNGHSPRHRNLARPPVRICWG